jgi:hypothetical protein
MTIHDPWLARHIETLQDGTEAQLRAVIKQQAEQIFDLQMQFKRVVPCHCQTSARAEAVQHEDQ